ncbi:MAG: hypothetical protein KAI64_04705 [Thermoplasmata archaeon]|nr:hypothetical protein [Thermoplasmata archaeon]
MELITPAELSRRLNLSRQAISKAIKREDIRTVIDGKRKKVDLHDARNIEYIRNHNPQRKELPDGSTPEGATDGNGGTSASGGNGKGGSGLLDQADPLQSGALSMEARNEKMITQTAREKMALAKEMGILIEKVLVDKLFDKLYAIIINHFHPLGQRLSSALADIAGITDPAIILAIQEKIDEETARGLNEFKRESENATSRIES